MQFEGSPWGRESDVLGVAVGQVIPSDDYKQSNANLQAKTEGHVEAYYKIQVNDNLSISPDFQYIWNPYGKDVSENSSDIFCSGYESTSRLLVY